MISTIAVPGRHHKGWTCPQTRTEWRLAVDEQAEHQLCEHLVSSAPWPNHCARPALIKAYQALPWYVGLSEQDWQDALTRARPQTQQGLREYDRWVCARHTFACPPACPLCGGDLGGQGYPHTHIDQRTGWPCRFAWRPA